MSIGRRVVIKARAEFSLTDDARLRIGNHCLINSYVYFLLTKPNPSVIIGNHVSIGRHTIVAAKGQITIGDFTRIAPYCQIQDHGHSTSRKDLIMNQPAIIEPIVIGRDCWIGAGVRILKGVAIGDGAVIGAGSVITGPVPPYEVWAGAPARKIANRE